jgi:hypothetical protein
VLCAGLLSYEKKTLVKTTEVSVETDGVVQDMTQSEMAHFPCVQELPFSRNRLLSSGFDDRNVSS